MNLAKANRLLAGQILAVVLAAASLVTAEVSAQFQAPPGVLRRAEAPPGTDWVRAGLNTNLLIWGIRGGLLWGLPPATGQPSDGPRGFIRLRYPVLTNGGYDLLNFIAVEPVVRGQRGFSELEPSQLDGVSGKRLWVDESNPSTGMVTNVLAGRLTRLDTGAERLTVEVAVERFENGAHVRLTLSQVSDAPDELELTVHPEPDSAPIEYCILSATMGNKARARQLWLKDRPVSSLDLYEDYKESGFTPHRVFPLERLRQTSAGDILAAIITDEVDPATVDPHPAASHWRYSGYPVTQYWRKPAGSWGNDLQVGVNGRFTYWMSHHPIPGGVAFENFEMRERFHPGQRFVCGITRRTPGELGLGVAREEPRIELAKWDDAATHRSSHYANLALHGAGVDSRLRVIHIGLGPGRDQVFLNFLAPHGLVPKKLLNAHRGWGVTFAAPVLIATKAMAPLLLALLLSAPGLALVCGAVKHAELAVQATAFPYLLGQFGVDFPEVMV